MAPPRTGTRGSWSTRDTPFHREHDASVGQRPTPPQTFAACKAWFVDAWEASLPTRLHTRGVEDGGPDGGLGSPRLSGAMHARTDHVTQRGWGITGWDRDGQPRGVDTATGLTRDPFLHYLELLLRKDDPGAVALVRWAYVGFDTEEAANNAFVQRIRLRQDDPDGWKTYHAGYVALLEQTIRRLWHDCQREPVRFAICRGCRKRDCVCSEAQVNAERATG